jgi:ATP-dependent DNA helicase RecG
MKGLADLAELPVTVLKGVGPERAKALEQIDIETVLDVVTHYPRRYLDKTKQSSIRDLRVDETTWVFGRVVSSTSVPGRGRGKARTELRITDGSGYLRITFFNQPWRTRQLPEGSEGMFFGKVTEYRGQMQMANPEIDLLDEDDRLQIAAIYPQSDKLRLYSKEIRAWVAEALRRSVEFIEPVPAWVLDAHDFVDRNAALWSIHRP